MKPYHCFDDTSQPMAVALPEHHSQHSLVTVDALEEADSLRALQGICLGMLLSVPIWIIIGVVIKVMIS